MAPFNDKNDEARDGSSLLVSHGVQLPGAELMSEEDRSVGRQREPGDYLTGKL